LEKFYLQITKLELKCSCPSHRIRKAETYMKIRERKIVMEKLQVLGTKQIGMANANMNMGGVGAGDNCGGKTKSVGHQANLEWPQQT
jgi:hypothetical protein